jgi:hypothetical protein
MGTTYLHAVASLDCYIADEGDDVGPLHDWYFQRRLGAAAWAYCPRVMSRQRWQHCMSPRCQGWPESVTRMGASVPSLQ